MITDNSRHIKYLYYTSIKKEGAFAMSKEDEINYFKLYRETKNVKYRDIILKAHLRYVKSFVAKYKDMLNYNDLINEGNLGLCHAIELYDYNSDARFLTYARDWVKKYVYEFLKFDNCIIKNSETTVIPLDNFIHDDSDDVLSNIDKIENKNSNQPDDSYEQINMDSLLNSLPIRSKTFVELRFGLNDKEQMSIKKIHECYGEGLTYERIRQIIDEALNDLKHKLSKFKNIEDVLYRLKINDYDNNE